MRSTKPHRFNTSPVNGWRFFVPPTPFTGRSVLRPSCGGSFEQELLVSGTVVRLRDHGFGDLPRQLVRSTRSDRQLTNEQRVVANRAIGIGTSAPLIRLTVRQTVFPNAFQDRLFGDADRDWFFSATAGSNSIDLFPERQLDEELTLLN